MKIFCDNQAARHIASNPVISYVKKKIQVGEIETPFVRSQDQLADVFIKGLEPKLFKKNTSKLELIDIYNSNLKSVRNYS
jgi:hypothetical protein